MTHGISTARELSRPVRLADLGGAAKEFVVTPTAAELDALARRYGIERVVALSATARVSARSGGKAAVAAFAMTAEVEQASVVSLDPVRQTIEEEWRVRYLPSGMADEMEGLQESLGIDPEAEDVEIVDGESIDIGETIAQQLSLALDPYPRGRQERIEDHWRNRADDEPEAGDNPFEILKSLRQDT